MSDTAVEVMGLSKRYRRGLRGRDKMLRETIQNGVSRAFRALRGAPPIDTPRAGDFWAIKDVSFRINRGEAVGIIGRNGAGKSTLLKILSRITDPTEGRARIRGRVGSLLEVGTGFHQELTGRENIYLNGTILGMKRSEIKAKFDQIVAFSEIEEFLDTPVKRYSSGMYVRLAFAVAAHLEPDILIVDEVLAVGDAAFQKKCLGRMETVANEGRTVLFVSHNMGVVRELCSRAVMLSHGRVVADAPAGEAVAAYLAQLEETSRTDLTQRTDRGGKGGIRLRAASARSLRPAAGELIGSGDPVRITLDMTRRPTNLTCVLSFYDSTGVGVLDLKNSPASEYDRVDPEAKTTAICDIDALMLVPGRYRMDVELWNGREMEDKIEGVLFFDVVAGKIGGRLVSSVIRRARVILPHRWVLPG